MEVIINSHVHGVLKFRVTNEKAPSCEGYLFAIRGANLMALLVKSPAADAFDGVEKLVSSYENGGLTQAVDITADTISEVFADDSCTKLFAPFGWLMQSAERSSAEALYVHIPQEGMLYRFPREIWDIVITKSAMCLTLVDFAT